MKEKTYVESAGVSQVWYCVSGGWICEDDGTVRITLDEISTELIPSKIETKASDQSKLFAKLVGSPVSEYIAHPKTASKKAQNDIPQQLNGYPPFSMDLSDSPAEKAESKYLMQVNEDVLQQLLETTRSLHERNREINKQLEIQANLIEHLIAQRLYYSLSNSFQASNKAANLSENLSENQKQYPTTPARSMDEMNSPKESSGVIDSAVSNDEADSAASEKSDAVYHSIDSSFSFGKDLSESAKIQRTKIFAERAEARMRMQGQETKESEKSE